jgi:hypothetical protein
MEAAASGCGLNKLTSNACAEAPPTQPTDGRRNRRGGGKGLVLCEMKAFNQLWRTCSGTGMNCWPRRCKDQTQEERNRKSEEELIKMYAEAVKDSQIMSFP